MSVLDRFHRNISLKLISISSKNMEYVKKKYWPWIRMHQTELWRGSSNSSKSWVHTAFFLSTIRHLLLSTLHHILRKSVLDTVWDNMFFQKIRKNGKILLNEDRKSLPCPQTFRPCLRYTEWILEKVRKTYHIANVNTFKTWYISFSFLDRIDVETFCSFLGV